ncbi:ABC-type nitrate/sulfonate/bicarbonate transport system ATPase subunit [Paenibacillus sp. V4I3]|nr:ABC-type nitrate/sulfonate/bicarbonate transport system ATPase subunit [Paenibacillus sp. V4I3]
MELVAQAVAERKMVEARPASRELAPTERSDSMNIIELNEVTKSYARGAEELQILRGITLHIAEGDFVAIIGPSGSGKSTLMNTIGLLDSPTSGSYYVRRRCDREDVRQWTC